MFIADFVFETSETVDAPFGIRSQWHQAIHLRSDPTSETQFQSEEGGIGTRIKKRIENETKRRKAVFFGGRSIRPRCSCSGGSVPRQLR